MNKSEEGVIASRYAKLENNRRPFLDRAREASKLTIPGLLPPEGHDKTQSFSTPWQSVGARGVNNLAAKMLLAAFPANIPFFRFQIDDFTLEELTQQEGMRAEVEKGLGKIERALQTEFNDAESGYRVDLVESLKHLIVAGNVLLFMPTKGTNIRVFHLDRFVARRDAEGNLLEVITVEYLDRKTLPGEIADQLSEDIEEHTGVDKDLPLYTRTYLSDEGKWEMEQEVTGLVVNTGSYKRDRCPFMALRWSAISNEDYGRGYVEEYYGDLQSLEGLSQTIVEGAAIAAKVVIGKRPNSKTKIKDFAKAENGAIITGDLENDLTTWQADKGIDIRVAQTQAVGIEQRLNLAFLLSTQAVRDAERVTAEEIRFIASELEDSLGGVYSLLSQELQLPFIKRLQWRLEGKGRIPKLPKDDIKPIIVTGVEALGRGQDITNLRSALEDLAILQNLPPEIGQRVNLGDLATRIFTARGVDTEGLFKSDEEIQAEQQQAQMMQMVQELGPNAVNQAGQMMQQQQEISNNGESQAA